MVLFHVAIYGQFFFFVNSFFSFFFLRNYQVACGEVTKLSEVQSHYQREQENLCFTLNDTIIGKTFKDLFCNDIVIQQVGRKGVFSREYLNIKRQSYISREELFEEGSKYHGWRLNSVEECESKLFFTKLLDVSLNANHDMVDLTIDLKAGTAYVKAHSGITKNVAELVSDIRTPTRKQILIFGCTSYPN